MSASVPAGALLIQENVRTFNNSDSLLGQIEVNHQPLDEVLTRRTKNRTLSPTASKAQHAEIQQKHGDQKVGG